MFRIGTYLALIRSMAVGDLVKTFYSHSDLLPHTHARLARTRNTLRELVCHGFASAQGLAALQRLRDAHHHVHASADDYRYVLALFMLEPLRWNAAVGGSALSEAEAQTLLSFWTRIGQEMGVAGLNMALPAWRQFQLDYEARYWCFSAEGQQLAEACLQEVVSLSLPFGTRSFFRQLMRFSMDPALRDLLQLQPASAIARCLLGAWLRRTTR